MTAATTYARSQVGGGLARRALGRVGVVRGDPEVTLKGGGK